MLHVFLDKLDLVFLGNNGYLLQLFLELDLSELLLLLHMCIVVLKLHRFEALYNISMADVLLRQRRQHVLHEVLLKTLVRGDLQICYKLPDGFRVPVKA